MTDAIAIEAKVQHLRIGGDAPSPDPRHSSPLTTSLLQGSFTDDKQETMMRQCFSEAYEKEVEYLSSLNIQITRERKRQILADILVWAEVTQQHYDNSIRSFVLEPNQHDESFQRVGKFLRDAKAQRGL